MKKVANFYPGPAFVHPDVYQAFWVDGYGPEGFMGTGVPIGGTSHRSQVFLDNVQYPLTELTRKLLKVPDNYSVLWTRDGATEQWARIVRNFGKLGLTYVHTGDFSGRALKADKSINPKSFGNVYENDERHTFILMKRGQHRGLTHITCNNTVEGIEFQDEHLDDYKGCLLVADATSNIFSREIQWEKHNFGMVYASTTKNIGQAGNCLVIIRNDLLELTPKTGLADSESYRVLVEKDSGLYTNNVSNMLLALQVLRYYEQMGGVAAIQELNQLKAEILYHTIDTSGGFYDAHAMTSSRSLMNVVFYLQDESLRQQFLTEADAEGLLGLKGHKILPGSLRASIYNMMPLEDVERLAHFMQEFQQRNS